MVVWQCQDICSGRTTQQNIRVLCCIVWRFAWIQNRQYRQLRRPCGEISIHSVFTLPEPLLSASYCILFCLFCCSAVTTACSTAAVPSEYGRCDWCFVFRACNHACSSDMVDMWRRLQATINNNRMPFIVRAPFNRAGRSIEKLFVLIFVYFPDLFRALISYPARFFTFFFPNKHENATSLPFFLGC